MDIRLSRLGEQVLLANWNVALMLGIWCFISSCDGHGRLIEPPSRASAWRYGFPTLPDYNDHESYCGGFTRQWKHNGGKCGECGDAWDIPEPRPHENGGQWGKGLIVRRYLPGSILLIRIELTASHMGYFEFRVCPKPSAKQSCFDQNVLSILGGSPSLPGPGDLDFRFYPRNGSRIYEIKSKLPDYTCDHCVLQWRYVAGNNWGMCSDGNGAVGCGPQEEFRSCSDIALALDAQSPIRPTGQFHPTFIQHNRESNVKNVDSHQNESLKYLLIFLSALFLILFLIVLYRFKECKQFVLEYILCYQKSNLKSQTSTQTQKIEFDKVSNLNNIQVHNQPMAPPRTKRNEKRNRLKDDIVIC